MLKFSGLLLLACVSLSPFVSAATVERQLLDGMSKAFRELDYQGVFTYEYGSEMESMKIIHGVRDGEEIERLIFLNGEPREIYRRGHHLNCVHPGDQILRLGHTISSGPFARSFLQPVGDIEDYYVVALGETKRIAGRQAQEIKLQPKDKYRNGLWLYLDKESALLLKSTIISPEGRPLERFQFASIAIDEPIADENLFSTQEAITDNHQILSDTNASSTLATVAGKQVTVAWLPPGFTLAARSNDETEGQPLRLAMYTDGLATLSVFIEKITAESALDNDMGGRARRGATVAYTRQLQLGDEPYRVTVVGEVPLFTAARVARYVTAQAEVK